MATQYQLPLRGKEIETRPVYIEEWLDSLPYIDFDTSAKLMHQALLAINAVHMKSTQRMELVTLFHRPYKYYLDTQIRAGAQHTAQSIDAIQKQLTGLKQLAIQLGRASRMAMDEALTHKSLWGQNKYPLQEIVMTMTYLSHALIFSFLEYAPTPQKVWKELNFLYQFAENINQHRTPVKLVQTSRKDVTSIERRYKRIALIAVADPYHLPFGAIWEIYEQLHLWNDLAELGSFQTTDIPSGHFVINLNTDNSPLPYEKFNLANVNEYTRILDTNKLLPVIKDLIETIHAGKKPDGLHFSPYYAEYLLRIIEKAWGKPPKRDFPRKAKNGELNIAHGLNSIYFYLNDENEFRLHQMDREENEEANLTNFTTNITNNYSKDIWKLVDTSGGGIAVTRDGKPMNGVRVGDLIGFNLDEKNNSQKTFRVGVLRWMLVRQGRIYKAGVQIINQPVFPGGVRAAAGNRVDREYRRAILTGNPVIERDLRIITHKGLFEPDRELEIYYNNKNYRGKIKKMVESTTCFEELGVELL